MKGGFLTVWQKMSFRRDDILLAEALKLGPAWCLGRPRWMGAGQARNTVGNEF